MTDFNCILTAIKLDDYKNFKTFLSSYEINFEIKKEIFKTAGKFGNFQIISHLIKKFTTYKTSFNPVYNYVTNITRSIIGKNMCDKMIGNVRKPITVEHFVELALKHVPNKNIPVPTEITDVFKILGYNSSKDFWSVCTTTTPQVLYSVFNHRGYGNITVFIRILLEELTNNNNIACLITLHEKYQNMFDQFICNQIIEILYKNGDIHNAERFYAVFTETYTCDNGINKTFDNLYITQDNSSNDQNVIKSLFRTIPIILFEYNYIKLIKRMKQNLVPIFRSYYEEDIKKSLNINYRKQIDNMLNNAL